jgi:hypothetical protein
MSDRSHFAGMLAIIRYNWQFYLGAAGVIGIGSIVVAGSFPPIFFWGALIGLLGAGWFLVGSLAASYWVYDRSPLYRWKWLDDLYSSAKPRDALICVAGFDEASSTLTSVMPETCFTVVDHYDAAIMTEPSISRARRAFPPGPESIAAPFDRWPALKADLILAPLAIHELRSESERSTWFAGARGALRPEGRIVVIEHVRDLANFLAFGPGFMHFHAMASWRSSWQSAGLELERHFRITPFVRVFVLR